MKSPQDGRSSDVLIIGAGLSGLSAANRLVRGGRTVAVLEARERVGGRSLTVSAADGTPVDLGGQWVGPGQRRILGLIRELGLETFPQFHKGRKHLRLMGENRTYRHTIPSLPAFALIDLQLRIWWLEALARRVRPDAPWDPNRSHDWDALSAEQWIVRHARTEPARRLLRAATHAVFAAEPRDISFLQFLFYLRSAGGLSPLIETAGGAQDTRVAGGMQTVSEKLAARIRAAGGQVLLNTPADSLEQNEQGVRVKAGEQAWTAQRAIVAMSPADAARLDFGSAITTERRELAQHMPMGSVIKCVAIYPAPFWRESGNSGEFVSDEGPMRMGFDGTPQNGRHGALVGFILGDAARHWSAQPPELRQQAVLRQWTSFFGVAAARPVQYLEHDWCADPWTRGCYVGLFQPGHMTRLAPRLRPPAGRVHWAGTETALRWNGYLDGAIEAGLRAADEVLAQN